MSREHILSDHEQHLLRSAHEGLKAITMAHSPRCQCSLCMAAVMTDAETFLNHTVENVLSDPGAGQRVLDQIDLGEAMLR